jgi:hypothetical protein
MQLRKIVIIWVRGRRQFKKKKFDLIIIAYNFVKLQELWTAVDPHPIIT